MLEEYCRDATHKDGRKSVCKGCYRLNRRERRLRRPQAFKSKDDRYYRNHREELLRKSKVRYKVNKHKYAAHDRVRSALQKGLLVRQSCEVCKETKTDAHHDDYSKPLDVRWLCQRHHRAVENHP